MKEILQEYATYNLLANQKITQSVLAMDEALQQQLVSSSYPNIYSTVLHIWDAESSCEWTAEPVGFMERVCGRGKRTQAKACF